ncbi:MAG: IS66 family transposase [Parvibaculaceae bacterium]|uniref:IS66 family transposase n=1 Tax=Thalassospira sp. TaxID=1912094 RepID=UPI0032F89C78
METLARQTLPDDIEALKDLVIEQQAVYLAALKEAELQLAKYEEERRVDRARRFGASTEAGDLQANLFDEAEAFKEAVDDTADETDADVVEVAAHSKRRPKRKPLPKDLPRVVVTHKLDESDKCCPCGCEMRIIGEKVSEQIDVIPAQVYILEHHRPTYSCPKCDESIKTVPMPVQPIPKSVASPGLLAHVAVAKYADGLPLYRQSKQFERLGIDLPRNTLARHMIKVGELIEPLIEALTEHIRGYDVMQMDETPVQVLKEPGKVARSKSYMWVMKGGPPDHQGIVYHYDPTRAQGVPKQLLDNYQGYLQTDGYAGYNAILTQDDIIGVGCWAHVRRKFMEAKKALPKADQNKGNRVNQALAFISKLYQLERRLKDKDPETRQRNRQNEAVPVLNKFKAWLDKQSVPSTTYLGKAIQYTQGQWPRLGIYLGDGRVSIDNNGVENAIRPFALGRKNWLFSDSQGGVKASANLYSLIETAKANGLNDYAYLKYVFAELPRISNDETATLLPWNIDPEMLSRQLNKPS